jgi:hypothetical protein
VHLLVMCDQVILLPAARPDSRNRVASAPPAIDSTGPAAGERAARTQDAHQLSLVLLGELGACRRRYQGVHEALWSMTTG